MVLQLEVDKDKRKKLTKTHNLSYWSRVIEAEKIEIVNQYCLLVYPGGWVKKEMGKHEKIRISIDETEQIYLKNPESRRLAIQIFERDGREHYCHPSINIGDSFEYWNRDGGYSEEIPPENIEEISYIER